MAVTWGVGRLDIFALDYLGVIKHQYWDGTAWKPQVAEFESLGTQCDPDFDIAVTTWGRDRLDIFCRGRTAELLHQYYDGVKWQPSSSTMKGLDVYSKSSPSVVSWGEDRLDVFYITATIPQLGQLYWNGRKWHGALPGSNDWEFKKWGTLSATCGGVNSFDVFAAKKDGSKELWHIHWNISQWCEWERVDDRGSVGALSVNSGSGVGTALRTDVVVWSADEQVAYKYHDGESWKPSTLGWYDNAPEEFFRAVPSVISRGPNSLDILGETVYGEWLHQAWIGGNCYPKTNGWDAVNGRIHLKSKQ